MCLFGCDPKKLGSRAHLICNLSHQLLFRLNVFKCWTILTSKTLYFVLEIRFEMFRALRFLWFCFVSLASGLGKHMYCESKSEFSELLAFSEMELLSIRSQEIMYFGDLTVRIQTFKCNCF